MAQLAIKGHATRGKEVIEILEMLGGNNQNNVYSGKDTFHYYFIDNETGYIRTKLYTDDYWTKLIYNIFTLEEFLEKFPYKVGDKVITYAESCIAQFIIKDIRWNYILNKVEYKICSSWCDTSLIQPCKEETMESKPNLLQQLKEYFDNTPRDVLEKEWHEYDKYNEIGPTVNEYLEYINKSRQPKYPKTYEECCMIIGFSSNTLKWDNPFCINRDTHPYIKNLDNLIENFYKLLICRDAYWKIAGEQMGLDKPWEPDWRNSNEDKYCIEYSYGRINSVTTNIYNYILAFPTAEMRDAFYENFKVLIEQCKELL